MGFDPEQNEERTQNGFRDSQVYCLQSPADRRSKARLTQIMNLLKLAPEIKDHLKNLNDPSLLRFFNEKRLRPAASLKNKQTQLAKFQELKGEPGIEESIHKMD